jgi:hypothetical protein
MPIPGAAAKAILDWSVGRVVTDSKRLYGNRSNVGLLFLQNRNGKGNRITLITLWAK